MIYLKKKLEKSQIQLVYRKNYGYKMKLMSMVYKFSLTYLTISLTISLAISKANSPCKKPIEP